MSRAPGVLLASVVLLAPIPTVAGAQSRWREQVNGQIEQAAKILKERGFSRTDTYDGSLDHEASEFLTLALRAGRQYALVAVCDNDCSDIDLRLYGPSDKELSADVEDDDKPVVTVAPTQDGKFRLKIIMAKCSTSPCFYGVGLFSK